ncbi:MAG TPA: tripartite tricarboxylate transporter substrate binding protein [Burkholderiales bacterium]
MRVLAILLCLASSLAWAQTYPERAIRLVVPWPAGGATDAAGRVMAQRLSERLSTPVVVENKAGAAGTIGAAQVARAPADGYTLLVASAETHAIAPNLRGKLDYDPLKDFVAITPFAINPFVIVARADFPAGTTKELVAVVKGQPGKFSYSSAGLGSTSQIAMETFKALAGLDILHVPFQGQAPAITSLLGGQTDLQMLPAGSAAPLRKGGKLKAFAVSTRSRFFDLPDVPTLAEEGFEMNFANWFGLVAPAGSPAAAVQRLAAESTAALKSAETQAALKKIGLDVFPAMSPAEFEKFLEAEMTRWGGVIRGAGIKAE